MVACLVFPPTLPVDRVTETVLWFVTRVLTPNFSEMICVKMTALKRQDSF